MKRLLIICSLFGLFFLGLSSPVHAQLTRPWDEIKLEKTPDDTQCAQSGVATLAGVECLFINILGIAITVIGLASAAMLVVGAFLYLTSGGKPKGTEAAQKTISFALLGLVVAISAWIILNFVHVFTGSEAILHFGISDK